MPANARFTGFCIGMLGDLIFLTSVLCMKDSWRAGILDKDASEGMLKCWYRTENYDVTAFEQEYLEMIKHWEVVYGKGTENDRKQL